MKIGRLEIFVTSDWCDTKHSKRVVPRKDASSVTLINLTFGHWSVLKPHAYKYVLLSLLGFHLFVNYGVSINK